MVTFQNHEYIAREHYLSSPSYIMQIFIYSFTISTTFSNIISNHEDWNFNIVQLVFLKN